MMMIWHKVVWLFVWTTMAIWLGGLQGCTGENQNYRINEEQTPLFEEGYPTKPPGAEATPATRPSLAGADRSHWEPVVVGPARGNVPHHPIYFHSSWSVADRPSPITAGEMDIDEVAARVTDASRTAYNPANVGNYALPYGEFAFDAVMLPVNLVTTPPWTIQYTPSR